MTNRLLKLFIALPVAIATTLPAASAVADVTYETVDAVMPQSTSRLTITGIKTGQSAPTTQEYILTTLDISGRCERMAVLAMSRPGKYRLTMVGPQGSELTCRLSLRAP